MAVYKVPQDVEADDKLIGPFSFRQFIYLIIVAMSGALAWGLAQIFIGLAIIPLPIMLFFGALALPLRKDQPMEIYLAAIVSFQIKPRKRLWDPDGIDSLIEITAPKTVEPTLTKGLSEADAQQRLSYLANLVDSGGWAIRGVPGAPGPATNSPMNADAFIEAQATEDVLDTNNTVAQSFDTMMEKKTAEMKEEAAERMHQPFAPPASFQPTPSPFNQPAQASPFATPTFDPYPTDIQQAVIQPVGDVAHQYVPAHPRHVPDPTPPPTPPAPAYIPTPLPVPAPEPTTTSDNQVSPDIMSLANNPDLSIETIAHEAQRIHNKKKDDMSDEVVISLR